MPVGRPTKYNSEMCKIAYNEFCEGASITEVSAILGITRETFYDWDKNNPEFSDAVKKGLMQSEAWWMKRGRLELCNKEFSPALWYMNMKNRFKWTDRQEQNVEISGNVSIADKVIEARKRVENN